MQGNGARPYHHGDLKRVLIETAQEMLREDKGWQFTLREVARRAGVSHAAPYKHFPDKGALLAELAMLGFNELRAQLAGAIERPLRSARAELIAAAKAYVHFATANPSLYRLMFSADVDKAAFPAAERSRCRRVRRAARHPGARPAERRLQEAAGARPGRRHWALVHGFTMLAIDGQLLPEKVGAKPLDGALTSLLDGLES